ncbi:MAG: hypothetical protein M0R05_02055 [Bacilli bacterium]|nr:hypothetical protein [Bacilli bacterium]MDD4076642.1 hypothetical protein [Bacilli bacterium]MDD4388333.1 hypothetical protein [Bacilli bacterium]
MIKKCGQYVLILALFSILFGLNLFSFEKSNDLVLKDTVQTVHADFGKDYSQSNLLEEFDYSFLGKIDSYICTSQFNGYGTEIPYSFFKVNVLHTYKGELEKTIIIKFYGGYDENNNLILLENMTYPQKNEAYIFYCNKTTLNYDADERTLDNSYVITMPYNLIKQGSQSNQRAESIVNKIKNDSLVTAITPLWDFDDGGEEPEYINTSFATAATIVLNVSTYVFLYPNHERYYKITNNKLRYLSFYSLGSLDTWVFVYDSSYNFLGGNDNVTGRGSDFTTELNFFYNFYADINQTYYIKVKFSSSSQSGSFHIKGIEDNWYSSSNINDLFWNHHGVNGNKVHFTNSSRYTTEINNGIAEWNKLTTIQIVPGGGCVGKSVSISDYTDTEPNAAVAMTSYNWIFPMTVKYNTYFFNNMTQAQRIKTVLHEFGHVLGLDEFTGKESIINVMHQGIRELTILGPADIAAYRAKWG